MPLAAARNSSGLTVFSHCSSLNRRMPYASATRRYSAVPEAISAFLEGEDFEDVIRTAVSLGGDCDTLTAIAGSMAEALYGVPADLKKECYDRLDENLRQVLLNFEARCQFNEDTI